MNEDHSETIIGLHYHDLDTLAGLEVACACGAVLFIEEDLEGLIALSELNAIADRHRDSR
jgi:hypothetical protein